MSADLDAALVRRRTRCRCGSTRRTARRRARRSTATSTPTSLVVGGGFTGLWTALRAKERDPDRAGRC